MTIGASYGDAFLAGIVSGILNMDDLTIWVKEDTRIHPNPQNKTVYDLLYNDFLKLYEQNKEIMHHLSEITE